MILKELIKVFDNDTKIVVKISNQTIYDGIIYNCFKTLDTNYRDFEICNCRVEDNKLDILLEE